MSVGIFKHPLFGETKQYILNNKQVLETKHDIKMTDDWTYQYQHLKQTFLKNQQIKFYLLPEEIYLDKDNNYSFQEFSRQEESFRVILYDHFILTLRQELQIRIQLQQRFTRGELWYFLYALTCAAIQMIKIYQQNPNGQQLQINLDNILLNQYGYLKLVGYFSAPLTTKKRGSYKPADKNMPKYQLVCSLYLARILACLIMLKDIDQFYDAKLRVFNDVKIQEELQRHEEQIGIMYNLLKLMFTSNTEQRVLVSQIKGMLLPYQAQILQLKDFTLDKDVSRQSLIQLFVND